MAVDVSGLGDAVVTAANADTGDASCSFVPVRALMGRLSGPDASECGLGRSLLSWHEKAAFCGKCGAPTLVELGGMKRVCGRGECGITVCVCVCVGVGALLLIVSC